MPWRTTLPEKYLYHYCDINALMGILGITFENAPKLIKKVKAPELWMTNTHFLNDHLEKKFFSDTFFDMEDVIRRRLSASNKTWDELLEELNFYYREDETYVICFSIYGDFLPLWRLYTDFDTPNNQFCIKFNKEKLISTIDYSLMESNSGGLYNEVRYFSKKELEQHILDKIVEVFCLGKSISELDFQSEFFKHESFKYEGEFRVSTIEDFPPFFITRENIKVPKSYLPLKVKREMDIPNSFGNCGLLDGPTEIREDNQPSSYIIEEIIVGPLCDDSAIKSLERITDIRIKKSNIPLRF